MADYTMAANRVAWRKFNQRLMLKKSAFTFGVARQSARPVRKSVSRREGGMGADVSVRGYTRSYPSKKG